MKTVNYPVAIPEELYRELKNTSEQIHVSMADTIRQSLKLGLPTLREKLGASRLTTVDPLPPKVARKLYALPDDDTDAIVLFMKAQSAIIQE